MVATENALLPAAKVGGIADVIADLPAALMTQNVVADVVMPGYGRLAAQNNAELVASFDVPFAGHTLKVQLAVLPHPDVKQARIFLIDHAIIAGAKGDIYSQDEHGRPFAYDATKFALFCISVATALKNNDIGMPDVLHLHDWHTGMLVLLRAFDDRFAFLRKVKTVFTVHNLALQGIRPLSHDDSSLAAWYPGLYQQLSSVQLSQVTDPRYGGCINPMRTGIVLSDKVHLVSPSYAEEVILASDAAKGFFGGEGLELDLRAKKANGALVGILNGCHYDKTTSRKQTSPVPLLLQKMQTAIVNWMGHHQWVRAVDQIALMRIQQIHAKKLKSFPFLLTSVGRLTDQKVLILRQKVSATQSVLEAILQTLQQFDEDALFVLLGSGDADIATEFREIASRCSNFIFLEGYHPDLPEYLYRYGDLFLMPSSFEPCGISQMLAMKYGQPCLVHAVGGLKDTVVDGQSGFSFCGDNLVQQASLLQKRLQDALSIYGTQDWKIIKRTAKAQHFSWQKSSELYCSQLYDI
ncbi:glycogen/starch synthase [Neptunicella marina]|uniref:starch synthase n=1 Tax=Neptunicella marina TaxID=2125989 RepID=A0A8J6M3D3_9ALTE|nr:glycogen/starch synthase [Neptunicella marina]